MNRIKIYVPVFMILTVIIACQKEKVATLEYPRLKTLPVTEISESGANFNAEIISGDVSKINECGFVWNSGDKLIINEGVKNNRFSGRAHSALVKGVNYEIYSYIKTDKFTVYGNKVSFISLGSEAPVISDFTPKNGTWGDTVRITGKNFRYQSNSIGVKLGDVFPKVISSTDTTIKVVIPLEKNSEKANLAVSILGNSSVSSSQFTYIIPQITSISPLTATFNDTIYIRGNNLFKKIEACKVFFNENPATSIYSSPTLIKVLVPNGIETNQSIIKIEGPTGSIEFGSTFTLKDMILKSYEPDTISRIDDIITIKGENLNPYSVVTIKGITAQTIEYSTTQLKVRFPTAIIPDINFSTVDSADINLEYGQQSAKFNHKLQIYWKSRWTKKKNFPGGLRFSGTSFSIGEKGYFGLGIENNNYTTKQHVDFWEYDPKSDVWAKKKDFPGGARNHVSSFVINGEGYIGLGSNGSSTNPYLKDMYKYNPATDTWARIADFGGKPRYSAASFVTNGAAIVGTGRIEPDGSIPYEQSYLSNDFWCYNPQRDQWSKILDFPAKTETAVGFSIGNSGYIYDFGAIKEYKESSWEASGSTPMSMRGSEVSFVIGSKGYIWPYQWSNGLLEFNNNNKQIIKIPIPEQVGCTETSIFTINGKAYIICGQKFYNTQNVWEFDPSKP